ncbi:MULTISPECIES: ATP-binding protein [Planococcus]|uniref:histidine kinase n=1 Tax=Planococcus faecalis TaxID=1598147 RepID=A0ABN4XPH5_9BACL|nr:MULTISPECIES: ATP-binding protein [Planococcus]AQU80700.1 histidine kinase [Planococcus faecalis]MDJ0331904.1 ATP-binding protein [Planococcus sp. S3-L1]OHX55694.1 histidine kinase [Planococcus faecalis]
MKNSFEKGIRYKYLRLTFSSVLVCCLLIIGINFYMNNQQQEKLDEFTELTEKQETLRSLVHSLNQLFFRTRGFYAFQNEQELIMSYTELKDLKKSIVDMNELSITRQEKERLVELSDFVGTFEEVIFPAAVAAVRNNDYEELRKLSQGGTNTAVNEFVAFSEEYQAANENTLNKLNEDMLKEAETFSFVLILLFVLLFIVIVFIILRALNDIVKPIEGMQKSIEGFVQGEEVAYKPLERSDELGVLSKTFHEMINTIQKNQEELTSQNQVLLLNETELQEKQTKLGASLKETEKTKERLIRFNELNHILSFTLDKQKLINATLEYFNDTYEVDTGVLWLPKTGEYTLKGFTATMFKQFQEERINYLKARLKDRQSFTVKREAQQEKGFTADTVYIHDLYASVKNEENDHIALIGLSRVGRTFSTEEEQDISGLLNRIHLAIDRIQLYDAAIHERTLNERIINNINEGIQFISKNGDMVQRNDTMCTMLNCGEAPLDTSITQDIWIKGMSDQTTDSESMFTFLTNCIRETDREANTFQYTVKEPYERVIDVYSTPVIVENEKTGTIFVHRDITREHEVDKMKSELVSTVSHELRTPLSSVLGFTELLLNKQLKPEKQERYLKTIYKEAKRLTNLINDFLDLQRMESGDQVYRMDKISLNEIIIETAEKFRTQKDHSIVFVDDASDVIVEGDQERIAQVLMNLIGNAVKFSPLGGKVTISIKNDANNLRVSIEDEGIGIPPDDIPKLFSKFQRIDNSSRRKIGGTGLGLAICQEIILQHDGKIWIESQEGIGSVIHFELPLVSKLQGHATHEGAEENPPVMIVEDDMSLTLLLSEELKVNGFKVIYHTCPKAAFEEAKRTPLVGAVIDIMLGEEMDGWDLVDMMKADDLTKNIPIVISSALDPSSDAKKINKISHYLTKPYAPINLSKVMKKLLAGQDEDGVIFYARKDYIDNE